MNKRQIKQSACGTLQGISAGDWYRDDDNYITDDGEALESVYLGTVFSLMPSGKYYMPYACSNVDLCPRCKGDGCAFCGHLGSREAYEDELFTEYLESYAKRLYNGWIESGEGDPCDVYLVRLVQSIKG